MAVASGGEGSRSEVQRLRDEFVALNGERMRYMAAFEQTKQTNEEAIARLRQDNKELKEKLARMQSDVATAHSIALSEAEADRLTGEVTLWRSRLDGLKHGVSKQSAEYSKLREELMSLHRQRSTAIDTPEMRAVRALENRLDKAMLKCVPLHATQRPRPTLTVGDLAGIMKHSPSARRTTRLSNDYVKSAWALTISCRHWKRRWQPRGPT